MTISSSVTEARSTSVHSLNADVGLNTVGKVGWLALNAANNVFAEANVDQTLARADFVVADLESAWDECKKGASPARRLCDLFWRHLPLSDLERELGGHILALEVGCGSGVYGTLLNKRLGDRVHYRGIDIVPHTAWSGLAGSQNYEFHTADSATDLRPYLDGVNFIFTQSAIEHFSADLTFFEQIADFVRSAPHPVYQVHLFPSASCISTFPWHGIRQYTPRTISKITRLFGERTGKTLYRLGSSACNVLHRRWITMPRYLGKGDRREREHVAYDRELKEAIRQDMQTPGKQVCFYALVLATGLRQLGKET